MNIQRYRPFLLGLLLLVPLWAHAQSTGLEHVFDADRVVPYI